MSNYFCEYLHKKLLIKKNLFENRLVFQLVNMLLENVTLELMQMTMEIVQMDMFQLGALLF